MIVTNLSTAVQFKPSVKRQDGTQKQGIGFGHLLAAVASGERVIVRMGMIKHNGDPYKESIRGSQASRGGLDKPGREHLVLLKGRVFEVRELGEDEIKALESEYSR